MRHLVVGDFARLGHEQLLLLFRGDFDVAKTLQVLIKRSSYPDSEPGFHVTDLEQFSTTDKVVKSN